MAEAGPVSYKEALEQLREWRNKDILNKDTGWALRLNKKGIEKIRSIHHPTDDEIRAIPHIPELVEKGVLVFSEKPSIESRQTAEIDFYHNFIAPVEIGKRLYSMRLVAREVKEGGRLLYFVEQYKIETDITGRNLSPHVRRRHDQDSASKVTIRDLLKDVKKDTLTRKPDIRYKIAGATERFVADPTKDGWGLSALEIAGGIVESMKPIRRWEVSFIDVNGEEARLVVDTQTQARAEAARLKKDGANEITYQEIEVSSWIRKIAASPEYFKEKPMREAVRVAAERTDRAAEIFNTNNTIEGEQVHQALAGLKKSSADDYDTLAGLLNWADRTKWGNKSAADRMKTTERLAREVGLGDDVITMWKKMRQGYDKDLDMLIDELTQLKTQAENAGIPEEDIGGNESPPPSPQETRIIGRGRGREREREREPVS